MSKASNDAHQRTVEILTMSPSMFMNEYICHMLARNHPILYARYADRYLDAQRKRDAEKQGQTDG